MNHPRLLLFCFIASGVLAAITLIPWGALEVFEFKTVDVRMWMRERFLSPAPRTGVHVYYYAAPGREADARRSFGRTPEMIDLYARAGR